LTNVLQHFPIQIAAENQAQDAVYKFSTTGIEKCIAVPVPSCGGAKAQELVNSSVSDAE
jgi:hypothetical protein